MKKLLSLIMIVLLCASLVACDVATSTSKSDEDKVIVETIAPSKLES